MAEPRGKWFETKQHRTAKKFATDKNLSLWKIELTKKDRASGKIVKTKRFYAGADLPASAKSKHATVDIVVSN